MGDFSTWSGSSLCRDNLSNWAPHAWIQSAEVKSKCSALNKVHQGCISAHSLQGGSSLQFLWCTFKNCSCTTGMYNCFYFVCCVEKCLQMNCATVLQNYMKWYVNHRIYTQGCKARLMVEFRKREIMFDYHKIHFTYPTNTVDVNQSSKTQNCCYDP